VTLKFVVKPDGSTSEISVVKSTKKDFEPAAKSAVERWKFARTAPSDGTKVSLECQLIFELND
jgi:TonB family protein